MNDRENLEIIFFFRFDKLRIPRENLLNSVADVSPDGQYLSAIKDPDQVVILKADCMLLLFNLMGHLITGFFPF